MRIDKPYMSGPASALKQLRKKFGFGDKDGVRHRCTCYHCGSKLVNLYFVNGDWMCRKCKKIEEKLNG